MIQALHGFTALRLYGESSGLGVDVLRSLCRIAE